MDSRIEKGMAAQFARRAAALADGERQIGWKSAFGSPAAMQKFDLATPLVGFMTDRRGLADGAAIDVTGWTKPLVEMEMAVYIGADVTGGLADAGAAAGVIAALGPAFEIIDPYASMDDLEQILSTNIYHKHYILGPRDEGRAGGDTGGLEGLIRHNDQDPVAVADVTANAGVPAEIVAGVANHLLELGEHLRAGDVVICGSIMPPIAVAAGDRVSYTLAPFDELTVSFR